MAHETVNHIKLRVERANAKTMLQAILQAIYFQRVLDAIEPETVDILETNVATAASREIEADITAKVDEFGREFVDREECDHGEIAVVFLQRKNRKGWFAVTEALIPYEEHLITVNFVTRATTNPLPAALLQVMAFCVEHKDNVPPLYGTPVETGTISHQIIISPPPPSELFAPVSPPAGPSRFTSPTPPTATTAVTALADLTPPRTPSAALSAQRSSSLGPRPGSGASNTPAVRSTRSSSLANADLGGLRRSSSPMTGGAIGYLEQAKDGLRAVGAKAAGAGWGGRAVGAAFGGRGG